MHIHLDDTCFLISYSGLGIFSTKSDTTKVEQIWDKAVRGLIVVGITTATLALGRLSGGHTYKQINNGLKFFNNVLGFLTVARIVHDRLHKFTFARDNSERGEIIQRSLLEAAPYALVAVAGEIGHIAVKKLL